MSLLPDYVQVTIVIGMFVFILRVCCKSDVYPTAGEKHIYSYKHFG